MQEETRDFRPAKVNGPRVELFGNGRVIVDGCDGILEYGDHTVTVKAGRFHVCINGQKLKLKTLTEDTAVVEGVISGVQYQF